jgi:hypothetical protein
MKSTNSQIRVGQRLKCRAGFADYVKTSAVTIAAAAPVAAMANFSGYNTCNSSPNGVYSESNGNGNFVNLSCTCGDFDSFLTDLTLDTTAAPAAISIAEPGAGAQNYTFLVTAAASGLVSFDYQSAIFIGDLSGPGVSNVEFVDQTTGMTFSLNTGTMFSTTVSAGDIFGFHLTTNYEGTASLTVTNFSAPEPANGVPDQGSTVALLAFGFVGLLAYRATAARRSTVCG